MRLVSNREDQKVKNRENQKKGEKQKTLNQPRTHVRVQSLYKSAMRVFVKKSEFNLTHLNELNYVGDTGI